MYMYMMYIYTCTCQCKIIRGIACVKLKSLTPSENPGENTASVVKGVTVGTIYQLQTQPIPSHSRECSESVQQLPLLLTTVEAQSHTLSHNTT